MSDTARKVYLITGAAGGLASLTVAKLHAQEPDSHLLLLVRDAHAPRPSTLPAPSDRREYISCDLADLAAVKRVCRDIARRIDAGELPRLHALVQTVGAVHARGPFFTSDGIESTVAVAHLAHFAQTLLLLPYLDQDGVIFIVGSDGHAPDYKFYKLPAAYKPLNKQLHLQADSWAVGGAALDQALHQYGTSKLDQMMIGHELARRLADSTSYRNIKVVMWEPGSMPTGLQRELAALPVFAFKLSCRYSRLFNWLMPGLSVTTPEKSSTTLVKLLTDRSYLDGEPCVAGGAPYYSFDGQTKETKGATNDPALTKELWQDSVAYLKIDDPLAL